MSSDNHKQMFAALEQVFRDDTDLHLRLKEVLDSLDFLPQSTQVVKPKTIKPFYRRNERW